MKSAKEAIQESLEIRKKALADAEEKHKKAQIAYAKRIELKGKELLPSLKSDFEKKLEQAIKEHVREFTCCDWYFSLDRYEALQSKAVDKFFKELKKLGYTAWAITENSEDYGSKSDPDYYCEGKQYAYVKVKF